MRLYTRAGARAKVCNGSKREESNGESSAGPTAST